MGFVGIDGLENEVVHAFRAEMPVAAGWAYFDHAAVGPLPKRTADAVRQWALAASIDGDVRWPEWSAAASRLRGAASELFHCSKQEIALIPNTTFGINIIANGYPWRAGDSLVVLANEFPSNLLPWLELEKRGVEVRRVAVDADGRPSLDRIRAAIDGSTRLVTVSWVGYATGYRLPLSDLCEMVHRAGAQLFVDAIQGLGVFPLDTSEIPIDYAAADGHKWMLGPEGAGFLYIRESHLERIAPVMVGWGSIESSHEFNAEGAVYKRAASRYEGGSANHVGLIGLEASLKLLLELGCHQPDNEIARAVLRNAASIREVLRRMGAVFPWLVPNDHREPAANSADSSSGIISFQFSGKDPYEVRRRLLDAGVVLSVRHGALRIATHAYNNHEDIERLEKGLVKICES
jgi:cysteine desulfurase/selenocysteine lyase